MSFMIAFIDCKEPGKRAALKILALAIFAAFGLLFLAGLSTASAHVVTPTTSTPADGTLMTQPPDKVVLVFPEEAGEKDSIVQVFDQQGKQVDLGNGGVDLNDPNHATLVVKLPVLAQGVYLVKWKIVLSDGDSSQGQYYFGVGNVSLPKDPPPAVASGASAAPGVSPAAVWTVAAVLLVALAIGIVFFSRKRLSKS
jgi:methionine-rich copper-binding protein CopC